MKNEKGEVIPTIGEPKFAYGYCGKSSYDDLSPLDYEIEREENPIPPKKNKKKVFDYIFGGKE